MPSSRTLVLGLGNPILSDDAVGLLVAREVRQQLAGQPNVDVRVASVAGFELLELLAGYPRAILVDAIQTDDGTPGSVYRLLPDALPLSARLGGSHEMSLPTTLTFGRMLGLDMPAEILIFAIEIQDGNTFGETCCPAVADAVGTAAALVLRECLVERPNGGDGVSNR